MSTPPLVLVPGNWLGGWAWDRVASGLTGAGHPVTALTLPGLESAASDRRGVRLADHVRAVADAVTAAGPDVVVVAHSSGGKLVSAVLDAQPRAVARAVYLDSGPAGDGWADDLPAELVEVPLPAWDELPASLDGLSPADLATFRRRAVPHPAGVLREPVRLTHPERRSVPTTVIACSFPAATVAGLAAAGNPMFAELAELTDLGYVDLPTGHWPMWSRPDDVVTTLLGLVG